MRRDPFQAIADPVRRAIIDLLAEQPHKVNAIAEHFSISRPAVSRHIRILRECGIVKVEQQGRERVCNIQPETLGEVAAWVDQYRSLWEPKLDSFASYLETLKENNTDHGKPE